MVGNLNRNGARDDWEFEIKCRMYSTDDEQGAAKKETNASKTLKGHFGKLRREGGKKIRTKSGMGL